MPATAGRVRMPANNRVHSSAALQTHGIWQSAIGYDPYAPDQKQASSSGAVAGSGRSAEQQNTYDSFQGLLALARLTGSNADEARGSCRKCGRVGHLAFQCRNMIAVKDAAAASPVSVPPAAAPDREAGLTHRKDKIGEPKVKGAKYFRDSSPPTGDGDEDDEDDVSDVSDSSEDSEMERYILERFGRNPLKSSSHKSKSASKDSSKRKKSSSKRHRSHKNTSEDDDSSAEEERRRSKHKSKSKRRHADEDYSSDEEPKRHRSRHKRRKDDEGSEEEKKKTKHRSKSGKSHHKHVSHSESDESTTSESEGERRRKKHSRKHTR